MKILKLSPYFYPERISSSHMSEDLYEEYKKRGYITETFAPSPTRGVTDEIRKKYSKIKYEEMYDGSLIVHRFSMFKEGKNTILRAFRYVLVNIIQYFKGINAKDVDLVLGASTPPTQGVLCAMVKKRLSKKYKKNIPLIYNLQDIFPDSLITANMTHKGSLIWKIGRKIEDYTYKNSDIIIVISEDFKRNIMAKGVPEEKIKIVPNWVDTDKVFSVDRKDNVLFERFNLDRNKLYISYSGNIGYSQNLDLIIKTAKRLKNDSYDINFVFIGEGAAFDNFSQRIKDEKLDNISLFPYQPYSDIASVFSLGDVSLIISKPGIGESSVPSKTWSIMSANRPVLCSFDKDSQLEKLITKVNCGIFSDASDEDAFLNSIKDIYDGKYNLLELGNNGRDYVVKYLDKNICVKQYVDTFCEILNG